DVGDVVRTVAVNGTMTARWPKEHIITNEKIAPGDVIVGFAGYGQSTYENRYNSGIGSNGLTSARHDVLQKMYAQKYPESFHPGLDDAVVYIGKYALTDTPELDGVPQGTTIGDLLLSATRTSAPLVTEMLGSYLDATHGMSHCSGGGQTKILKYRAEI